MTITDFFKVVPQYFLPQHALSKLMRYFTHSKNKKLKNWMITQVIKHYGVNMDETKIKNMNAFNTFNEFFTRELKPRARPITTEPNAVACPADGAVSQAGLINDRNIFQAKGKTYTLFELLGGNTERAELFAEGSFATIYLSPKDYHRLHMPLTGTLTEMVHIPGSLFSVNTATTRNVPKLFARNERVVAIFETEAGPMALILVGAIFVNSIETVWHGVVTPPTVRHIQTWNYGHKSYTLQKGEEMGRFNMGSTIIVLFGKDKVQWTEGFKADKTVRLGELIGKTR